MKKKLTVILAMVMALTLLWGCGAKSSAAQDSYYRGEGEILKEDALSAEAPNLNSGKPAATSPSRESDPGTNLPEGRKLIRKVNIEAQTKNMDALLPEIEAQVAALGGYLEQKEIYSGSGSTSQWRNANLTIRIPADKADPFLEKIGTAANVTSLNETLTDVTLSYVATESRIKALRAEQDRLLELMDQAQNLTELLEVEARLTDVISELEAVESQLRLYDNQIDYTSIHLSIRQVTEITTPEDEMTLWERISTGFMSTLSGLGDTLVDLFVWVVVSSPVLVLLGIIVFALYKLIRFIRKRKQK